MKKALLFSILMMNSGLFAQHEWLRTNPGGGGAIAVVGATVDGTIIVASDLSGIFRSYDDGVSFDAVGANQGILETHISALGFDPNDANTFYAGGYTGLYKTTDGGDSFDVVFPTPANPFDYSYIEDIAVAASNSDVAYVTHEESPELPTEIYKTTDGGVSWNNIAGSNLPTDLHIVKMMVHPSDENIVYALSGKARWGCGDADLYRSMDGGSQWMLIGDAEGDILDFDLHPTNPEIVFISTFASNYVDNTSCMEMGFDNYVVDDETAGELYRSDDGGQTFLQISDKTGIISVGITNPEVIRILDVLWPYDWNEDAGTWETADGGDTWTHTGFVDDWEKGYTTEQYFAFVGSFNGLNKSVTKDIFNSDRYYGSLGQWAWGSFDGGATLNNISTREISTDHWLSTGVENINGHALDICESNPNVVYMGGYDIGFWYTTDHGDSWTRTQPDFNIYPEYSWNLGSGVIPANWAKRGAGSNVMNVLVDPMVESRVWASFSNDQYTGYLENTYAKTGLFKSDDYGENWTLITNGLPPYNESLMMYGLTLDVNSAVGNRTMYVTVDGEIYRSMDDGNTWTSVFDGAEMKFLEVDKVNGNVYAGGKDGLWRSTDGGNNWSEVGTAAMHASSANTRPDIVPTWTEYSGVVTYEYQGVFDIASDPNNAGNVYVTVIGPNGGLYHSTDGGDSWSENLLPDTDLRGVAIAPANSNVVYATSSQSYHSGGYGNSLGVMYSTDAGISWQDANDGMAYSYAAMIEIETGDTPYVWTWSPGTGIQRAQVPFFVGIDELAPISEISVYPNPIKDIFEINMAEIGESPTRLEVYSALGEKVYSKSWQSYNVVDTWKVDGRLWAEGVYLIRVWFENRVVEIKVVRG